MTILAASIAPTVLGAYLVEWTGGAGATVRVFVNGALAYGPVAVAAAAKSVELSLPDPAIVEVHENDADDTVPAAGIALERRPLVWWSSVPGAHRYRVSIDGVLVATVFHDESRSHHEIVLSSDVREDGGAWRTLKIEAESASGRVGTAAEVPLFVPGVTAQPSDVEVTGSAGVFDVEVVA